MTGNAIGLDIGGANLKAATADGRAATRPFPLWQHPERLADELSALVLELSEHSHLTPSPPVGGGEGRGEEGWRWPGPEPLLPSGPAPTPLTPALSPRNGGRGSELPIAVTMTGELCDCFESKPDGVRHILASVASVFGFERLRIWSTSGRFLNFADAERSPFEVAAANWHALATFVGRFAPKGSALLVDVGSTTTDVIPLCDGIPVPLGRSDPERMQSRELVYTGVGRTPLCALVGAEVAAELFATTLDAYLRLGIIPEDGTNCGTADGRPATIRHSHARLARMLGGDAESISDKQTLALAQKASAIQRSLIVDAVSNVAARLPIPPAAAIVSGSGEFLASEAVRLAIPDLPSLFSIREGFGPVVSSAACAFAIAVLAAAQDE